jgi:hypothetical protein
MEDFAKLRYRFYLVYYPKKTKKELSFTDGQRTRYIIFDDSYIDMKFEPKISIVSRSELEIENRTRMVNLQAVAPLISQLSMKTKTTLAERTAYRELLRSMKFTEDEIEILIEETFEEMDAKDQVYLLNNYEKIK